MVSPPGNLGLSSPIAESLALVAVDFGHCASLSRLTPSARILLALESHFLLWRLNMAHDSATSNEGHFPTRQSSGQFAFLPL
jgi:hypothetical protein